MDDKQKATIDANRAVLIEALSQPLVLKDLFSVLEQNNVINMSNREILEKLDLSSDKVMRLLGSLKHNDSGWSALIDFLTNRCGNIALANRLNSAAGINVAAGNQSGATNIPVIDATERLKRQNAVLQSNVDDLCTLHADQIINHLRKKQLIKPATAQAVRGEPDDESKIITLLDRMALNPNFFDAIIDYLSQNGFTPLRDKLLKDLQEFVQ